MASVAAPSVLAATSHALTDGDKAFVEALAGAIGSVVATWAFYPLDTLKTRLQASTRIILADGTSSRSAKNLNDVLRQAIKDEGFRVLYDGIGIKSVYSIVQNFLYFYTFTFLKRKWENRLGNGTKIGVGANLLIGVAAGMANVMLTEPLDTISTAQQTKERRKKPAAVRIAAGEGGHLGNGAAAAADASSGLSTSKSAQKVTFDGPEPPASAGVSGSGGADGAAAAAAAAAGRGEIQAVWSEAAALQAKKGKGGGLYSGLWVSLLLTCNPAIQFTVFEQARRRLLALRALKGKGGGAEMSMLDAFVLGAASKAFATILTYPAIRAKVLLQAGRSASPTIVGTIRGVVERDGATGLYKGLNAQLLKTVLVAALMLTVKEKSFGAAYVTVLWARQRQAARKAKAAGLAPPPMPGRA